jgi:hypothetical protein
VPANVPKDVADLPLKQCNRAIFDYELIQQELVTANAVKHEGRQLDGGNYPGTELAQTAFYTSTKQW